MCVYNYESDYERECTQKYEGTYTAKEIELNNKLKEECIKENVDFEIVEELLKQGADTLGGSAVCGWDILTHVYSEVIMETSRMNSINLPEITELFLKYGMNVDNPRIPYDDSDSFNPLWCFTFVPNENSIKALKMLLDNGLSADSFLEFWDHSMLDYFYLDMWTSDEYELYKEESIWLFKMFLLGASYERILDSSDLFRIDTCCFCNTNDVHMFRDWNDFEYEFDVSHCKRSYDLNGGIIHIYSKKTKEEVWTVGIGGDGIEALKKLWRSEHSGE